MKKALLILLMLIVPLQTIAAAERNFMHVTGSYHGQADFINHFVEHAENVMHHHDDDGDDGQQGGAHADNSQKSFRHVIDIDHGFSLHVLLPAPHAMALPPTVRIAPAVHADACRDRAILPPRRPPRAQA